MLLDEGNRLQTLGAGPSRDVTFVAVGATVCFVATASGVGERATAVTTAANLTAGLSSWTLARTIWADDVLDALQCSCLSEEGKLLLALGAGSSRDVTFVAVGATVCFVAAASGVGERATAVTTAAILTAGLSSWTLARTIWADDVLDALQCSCLSEEGKLLLALGAASGVGERATAVTTAANLTAGLSSWTLARTIGADDVLDALQCSCLSEEGKLLLLALGAGSSRDVTFVAVGGNSVFRRYSKCVGERATAVTTAANLTAGLSSWTLARAIGQTNVLDAICLGEERKFLLALGAGLSSWTLARAIGADDVLDAICLGEERKFLLALGAGSSRDVTFVAVGATVCFVAAASGVGERATAVTTAANLTAGSSRDVTFVAVGATVCFVAAASGVGERATAVTTAANLTASLSSPNASIGGPNASTGGPLVALMPLLVALMPLLVALMPLLVALLVALMPLLVALMPLLVALMPLLVALLVAVMPLLVALLVALMPLLVALMPLLVALMPLLVALLVAVMPLLVALMPLLVALMPLLVALLVAVMP
eukprot:Em0202g13a